MDNGELCNKYLDPNSSRDEGIDFNKKIQLQIQTRNNLFIISISLKKARLLTFSMTRKDQT